MDTSGVDQHVLYTEVLKPFFINVVAHSFEFDFNASGGNTEARLEHVLDSSTAKGSLTVTYDANNTLLMSQLLDGIQDETFANDIMMSWLNANTVPNPNNPNERLFLVK